MSIIILRYSVYYYVNKLPAFKLLISTRAEAREHPNKRSCEDFKSKKLSSYTALDSQFLNTCEKIIDYLDEIKNVPESPKPAFCKYINYWLYDTLKEMQPFSYPTLLNDFYSEITKLNVCNEYKKSFDGQTYEELNELYKLYESFINFKRESTQNQSPSCKEADNLFQLYEESAAKCKWNYNNYFCWELMKFRAEYEQYLTYETKCKGHMKHLTSIGYDRVSIILFPFVVMSLISFVFIYLYNFTSFDSWLLSKLPGAKKKTKKKVHRMHELQRTSEMEGRRYKLPYHSS